MNRPVWLLDVDGVLNVGRALLIVPTPSLQPEHLDAIEAFIDAIPDEEPEALREARRLLGG